MRVTENSNYELVKDNVRKSREKLENLQTQAATLKKLNHPSEDPVGSSKLLKLRTDQVNHTQFQLNSKSAQTFLNSTDHAVTALSEIVLRAKEIALGQASEASANDQTRLAVSEEVNQLLLQAIALANQKVGDRYIFSGFKTTTPAVDSLGSYQGDDGQMMLEVGGGVFVAANIPGVEVFNTQSRQLQSSLTSYPQSGLANSSIELGPQNVNLFDELQNFRISLIAGDLGGIRDSIDRFDLLHGKLITLRSRLGSRLQGIESTERSMEKNQLTQAALVSSIEDADMAQVVSDLNKEEMIFRSSLASSKKLLQPTLLDFLKS